MIKQDYKPRNDNRAYKSGVFKSLPAWLSHPFAIIGYAILTLFLAILLFRDTNNSAEDSMIESSVAIVEQEAENIHQRQILEDPDLEDSGLDETSAIEGNLDIKNNKEYESGEIKLNTSSGPSTSSKTTITSSKNNKQIVKSKNISGEQLHTGDPNYTSPIAIPLDFLNNPVSTSESQYEVEQLSSDLNWETEPVKKNDNLSLIFKRIGLTPQMVHKIGTLDENSKILTHKLMPGKSLHYQIDKDKQLTALKYIIDIQKTLYIERVNGDKNQFASRIEDKKIEYRSAYVSGIITDSLYKSGKRSGLTDRLVVNLANIFAWDIDFILDIRKNDSFSVLYEEKYMDGEKIGNGNIIAAEFVNQGETFIAIRYTDSKNNTDYYSDKGLSLRKAFLRAPVKFQYISDHFNPKRFHPVQKRVKPHRGIDYVAPVGTPIMASGDGKVIASGYNRFNGKYVFIQHGNNIVTKYLHLSKRLVSKGKRVKQGQTIGKLGSTGMVTGAHLHYEFVVNGVHRNPRTVKLPMAKPISKNEKPRFLEQSKLLVSQLESRKQIQSAQFVAR